MSFLEQPQYCELNDFIRHEQTRLQINELQIDEFHLLFVALAPKNFDRQAAKFPTLVTDQYITDSGLYVVDFDVLDADLRHAKTVSGVFDNGYWTDSDSWSIESSTIVNGYFKGYNDGMEDTYRFIGESLQIAEQRLVGSVN